MVAALSSAYGKMARMPGYPITPATAALDPWSGGTGKDALPGNRWEFRESNTFSVFAKFEPIEQKHSCDDRDCLTYFRYAAGRPPLLTLGHWLIAHNT